MRLAAWIGKVSSMAVRQDDLYTIASRKRKISCAEQHGLVKLAAWPYSRVIFIQYTADREKSHAAL